eukprot:496387-Alexandrium_andersonii.AAC.1
MRNCLRRSKLELRGPTNGLKIDPRSSGGVRSASVFAQMPNPPKGRACGRMEARLGAVRGRSSPGRTFD